jgi:hypothetical protein
MYVPHAVTFKILNFAHIVRTSLFASHLSQNSEYVPYRLHCFVWIPCGVGTEVLYTTYV